MSDLLKEIEQIGKRAVVAKREFSKTSAAQRKTALLAIAKALEENEEKILKKNANDIENGKNSGLSQALLDRLKLTHERISAMASGMREVAKQEEVIDNLISENTRPNGLVIQKVTVPIGVIGIIFEARPNVTADSAALCLKSGNVCILRGGKEAINSNKIITTVMRAALLDCNVNPDCIQLIEDTTRESAKALMHLNGYVDVLIPRGGRGLIQAVCSEASVPVIETGAGTCHTYIDKDADIDMAVNIVFNAKTSRPSVCNACEGMLVHEDIAERFLPAVYAKLNEKNVEIRGDKRALQILPNAVAATDNDWGTEFLDYIMIAKIVKNVDEAIDYITQYGTMHSECIVTENDNTAAYFLNTVDASSVYHNASTRFTDGGEFGFGAEIGISTQKLHARGPLGLHELTSYKYKILGKGQVR